MVTWHEAFNAFLAGCAAFTCVCVAGGWFLKIVKGVRQPAVNLYEKLDNDNKRIKRLEDEVDRKEREYQQNHVDRMTRGECKPEGGMIFSDVISGLERVADHATNIAYAIRDSEMEDLSVKQAAVRA